MRERLGLAEEVGLLDVGDVGVPVDRPLSVADSAGRSATIGLSATLAVLSTVSLRATVVRDEDLDREGSVFRR